MNSQTRANSEKFHGFIKFFFNLMGPGFPEIKNPVRYFYLTGTKQKTNTMNKHYLSREEARGLATKIHRPGSFFQYENLFGQLFRKRKYNLNEARHENMTNDFRNSLFL